MADCVSLEMETESSRESVSFGDWEGVKAVSVPVVVFESSLVDVFIKEIDSDPERLYEVL